VLARIPHDRPGDLRVTLIAPDGSEKLVFDGPADPDFLELHESIDFGGDTPVNGPWTLRVVDEAAGATGRIERFEVWLGSRAE
jgi:subtilisin-like proprotein convertase family protein